MESLPGGESRKLKDRPQYEISQKATTISYLFDTSGTIECHHVIRSVLLNSWTTREATMKGAHLQYRSPSRSTAICARLHHESYPGQAGCDTILTMSKT
jgi:hypothetical protein